MGLAVFGQDGSESPEGVGLDHVAPDLQEGAMDTVDHVGTGDHQQFVASLEIGAPEVVSGQTGQLQVGTHGAVEDDHPLGDGL